MEPMMLRMFTSITIPSFGIQQVSSLGIVSWLNVAINTNICMAILRIPDHPNLEHFNTWQFDKLQILVDKNHGVLLFPS
jgi:hypothetical protein